MSAFGHFCAFCERPLPDKAWVWNARTGECLEEDSRDIQDWQFLYLLDHNCHKAQQCASAQGLDPSVLLLPASESGFTPLLDSPLRYQMQPVERVLVDERGKKSSETIDQVVVSGITDQANATIRYFALNTPYYKSDQNELEIPLGDYLSLEDRRMDQRTLVWKNAEMVALNVRNAETFELGRVVTEQFRLLAGSMGFWSSSVTASANILQNRNMLRRIFFEAAEMAQRRLVIDGLEPGEAVFFHGSGPHHTFPGTQSVFG
ncbi:hypothetical protein [Pseudomonas koreensis]|uniref:Uncharacterized protein n=1 Tax=Pseudomonas koreensis TaxID=198620 RepID=A0A9X3B1T1_9PSED|nr:hypothetical protein [Pseudomonas koreensis]MCU7247442.1 hypothetical protein [Pseudomonas koreensis]